MSVLLIERALSGEVEAQRELVMRLTPVITSVARRELARVRGGRVGVRELEDLVHDVFVALLADDGRALRRYDGRTKMRALFRVYARSRIRDIARKEHRRGALLGRPIDESEVAHLEGNEPRPDQVAEAHQLARRLRTEVEAAFATPLGRTMTDLLLIEQASTDDVQARTGKTRQQVFRWRSRVLGVARERCLALQQSV